MRSIMVPHAVLRAPPMGRHTVRCCAPSRSRKVLETTPLPPQGVRSCCTCTGSSTWLHVDIYLYGSAGPASGARPCPCTCSRHHGKDPRGTLEPGTVCRKCGARGDQIDKRWPGMQMLGPLVVEAATARPPSPSHAQLQPRAQGASRARMQLDLPSHSHIIVAVPW